MDCLPPEILSLVVSEIWLSKESLSSIVLASPNMTPFVREHRFKHLRIRCPHKLVDILAIIDSTEGISTTVRQITFLYRLGNFTHLPLLLSAAVKLKKLELRESLTIDWSIDLSNSLRTCTRLTTLSLIEFLIPRLSDLFQVLHSVPNLTTLTLRWLQFREPHEMSSPLQPNPHPFYCPQWDAQDFEAPKPLLLVSHLTLQLYEAPSLLLIDLLSSPKSPFPNLQELVFQDHYLRKFSLHRLPALLKRYHLSLRVLNLADGIDETFPEIVLPATVEHLKFPVSGDITMKGSRVCQILSSCRATLKIVTVRLHSATLPGDLQELDKVLECLNLDKWVLEVSHHFEAAAEWIRCCFELCLKRCADGEWEGGIVWVDV